MHFRITEFDDGNFIALESNFLFRPRVELWFSEAGSDCETHSAILFVRLIFLRNSVLFQVSLLTVVFSTVILTRDSNRIDGIYLRLSFRQCIMLFI